MNTQKVLAHLLKSIDQNCKVSISLTLLANQLGLSAKQVFWSLFILINKGYVNFSRLSQDQGEWIFLFCLEPALLKLGQARCQIKQ